LTIIVRQNWFEFKLKIITFLFKNLKKYIYKTVQHVKSTLCFDSTLKYEKKNFKIKEC